MLLCPPFERVVALVVAVAVVVAFGGGCSGSEEAGEPPVLEEEPGIPRLPSEFTNLEVLPADITKAELKRQMKLITKSLGVKCDYCHRTDTRDYATDEIPEKVVARDMMRMLEGINLEHFAGEDAAQVTCFMCHHSQQQPQLAPGDPAEQGEGL